MKKTINCYRTFVDWNYLIFKEKNEYEGLSNARKRNNTGNENRCKGGIESAKKKKQTRERKKRKIAYNKSRYCIPYMISDPCDMCTHINIYTRLFAI